MCPQRDPHELRNAVATGTLDETFIRLYGPIRNQPQEARARYTSLLADFESYFPDLRALLFTAAGRTEMGGNHTDHQHGRVLAASVSMDMVGVAGPNGTDQICIRQAGYSDLVLDVNDLTKRPEEAGQFPSLIRGVANAISQRGFTLEGFSAVVDSKVPAGSGLSSSAAYEVLIGNILNTLFCEGKLTPVDIAQIGQYAENVYFGKPSGLMDQVACAVGGIISVDFLKPEQPSIKEVDFAFEDAGHALCIIDSGADHANLTHDYASIFNEMNMVAAYFGAKHLRDVDHEDFWNNIRAVREATHDRAVLRAIHFFEDDHRVIQQENALSEGRFDDFLNLVTESGNSSAINLQNLYSSASPLDQAVSFTVALARQILAGEGAVRVHGGGFAGTVQAYVPLTRVLEFQDYVEQVLGRGSCHVLHIRNVGGGVIELPSD